MDEILYGGGQSVPVRASGQPDQPDESQVISDMFFVAPNTILANEFEVVATKPLRLEGAHEDECYVMMTLKGRMNNEKHLSAVTVIVSPEGAIEFVKLIRHAYSKIPLEHR